MGLQQAKLGYARFRAACEKGFYPLHEKPPGTLVDFYLFYPLLCSINLILVREIRKKKRGIGIFLNKLFFKALFYPNKKLNP